MSSGRVLGARPMLPLAAALAVGIAWARLWGLQASTTLFLTAACFWALAFFTHPFFGPATPWARHASAAALCLGVACFGASLWAQAEKKAVPPSSFEALLDGTERRYRVVLRPFADFYPEKTVVTAVLLARCEEPSISLSDNGRPKADLMQPATGPPKACLRPVPLPTAPVPFRVRLSVRILLRSWKPGDVVDMPLRLRPLTNFENPGRYDYVAEQARRGIFAHAFTKSDIFWMRVPENRADVPWHFTFFGHIDTLRGRLRHLLSKHLTGTKAALAQALFLGYRHMVPREVQEAFQKAGTAHLLAISGLHVGLAAWAAFRLVQLCLRFFWPQVLLKIPDVHLAGWAGGIAAAVYAVLAGFAVPTQRAFIMLAAAAAALGLYRKPDSWSLLSTAALLILFKDPNNVFRPSFQMSSAAVVGLVFFYPSWRERALKLELVVHFPEKLKPVLRLFLDAFLVSAAAGVAVAPLTVYHFHTVSVAGLAANTFIVPFLALAVLPPGLAALGLSVLVPSVAAAMLAPVDWALAALLWLVKSFADLPHALAHVGPVPLWGILGCYAALLLWTSSADFKKKLFITAALAIMGALFVAFRHLGADPEEYPFRVTVLDVGQGSATLVQCPPDAAMLVDGGGFEDDAFDVGRFVIAPALWAMGVHRLDAVVLSHDHPDHCNGLRYLLNTFPIGRYVETGLSSRGLTGSPLKAIAERRRIPTLCTLRHAQESFDGTIDLGSLGECRLRALHPTKAFVEGGWDAKSLNEASLVVEVTYGKAGALLPGDVGEKTERLWQNRRDAATRHWLLVAPHHGSATSTGWDFLQALRPQAVLISCGYENRFGFPSTIVLDRLQKEGLPVFRTDLHGAVSAVWDGFRWTLTPTVAERKRLHSFSKSP